VSVFWNLAAGVLLLIIGAFGVWLYRSPRFEDNPFAALLSRWLGVGGARILMLAAGIICLLLGIFSVVSAVTGT
jgi:hypothetical protein